MTELVFEAEREHGPFYNIAQDENEIVTVTFRMRGDYIGLKDARGRAYAMRTLVTCLNVELDDLILDRLDEGKRDPVSG